MQISSNECVSHKRENNCFCKACGSIMCPECSQTHFCPKMKKKVIEYLDESLLDNFKFEKYLGAGSSGSVFQVTSITDDKKYALKVIDSVDQESFQIAKKEIAIMAKIKHPNIIRYFSSNWLKKKELLWITMELCDGSLDDCIKNLEVTMAFDYFYQICEGVRAMHQNYKIIHRDLKPGNILLKNNTPKLCDFGEAKPLTKATMTLSDKKEAFGTLEYLAPEIFEIMEKDDPKYNEKTDIWALGIIFHKMLAKNIHPFLNEVHLTKINKISKIKKILHENDPKIDPSIIDPLHLKILKGCLEKSPKERLDIQELMELIDQENDQKGFGKLTHPIGLSIALPLSDNDSKAPMFDAKRYKILDKIKRNSIVNMSHALDCFTNTPVTLKIQTKHQNLPEDIFIDMIQHEDTILRMLNMIPGNRFLKYYGLYKHKASYVMIMEDGDKDLESILVARKALKEDEILYLFHSLASDLFLLNKNNICKGEIKPFDIIMAHSLENKHSPIKFYLSDYENAYIMTPDELENPILFTRYFTPPEMSEISESYDVTTYDPLKAEIYTFAITIMLFHGCELKNCKEDFLLKFNEKNNKLFSLLKKMTDIDPEKRPDYCMILKKLRKFDIPKTINLKND